MNIPPHPRDFSSNHITEWRASLTRLRSQYFPSFTGYQFLAWRIHTA